jgi:hypothetical protein
VGARNGGGCKSKGAKPMNRQDIIRMAREAGATVSSFHGRFVMYPDDIERFAALVAAAEREKVAAWMMARGYATGHGDTTEDLLKELAWQIDEDLDKARGEQ